MTRRKDRVTPFNPTRDSAWLNRPRRGYCGMCNRPVLYVAIGPRGGVVLPADTPGEILDIERTPTGRYDVLSDGFRYAKVRVRDGHRAHRCRERAPGRYRDGAA